MDDIMRKRNSSWDIPEASRPSYRSQKDHNSIVDPWRYETLSPKEADNKLINHRDRSKWPSREPLGLKNSGPMTESFYEDMQGEWGQRKYNRSPDDGLGKSYRYLEQRSERSRSRDRGRTRGRSRSWSRGGDNRNWSRSRSRSRSRKRARSRSTSRSRSPLKDHRHDSYGHSDRMASRPSSRVCRDFAVGKCRRGSQCRFLHDDNLFGADGNSTENDFAGKSRNWPELGYEGRYPTTEGPGSYSRDKHSEMKNGDDELSQSRSRGIISCKEFLKGRCKWGASCRFSHHVPSGEDNVRKASFERGNERRSPETGRTVCRYFQAGNCQRANCKFSHHAPTSSNQDDQRHDESESQSLSVSARHGGRSWDKLELESNKEKATGWSKNIVEKAGAADVDPSVSKDDSWCQEAKSWVGTQEKNTAADDLNMSEHIWNQNNGGGTGSTNPMSKIINDRYEGQIASKGLHHDVSAMHAEAFLRSDIKNKDCGEDGTLNTLSFEGHDVLQDSRATINPLVPGHRHNGNDVGKLFNHLVSNDPNGIFSQNSSNERNYELKSPGQLLRSLNFPNQNSFQKEIAQAPEMHEFVAQRSFNAESSNSRVVPMAYHEASPTPQFLNEQVQPHPGSTLISLTSTGLVPSASLTSTGFASSAQSLVSPVNVMCLQPNQAVRLQDHYKLLGDVRERNMSGNNNVPPGNLPYSLGQHDEMILEPFSPPATTNLEFEKNISSANAGIQHEDASEAKQPGATLSSEVLEIDKNNAFGVTEEEDDTNKETEDGKDKSEPGTNNKEEKEMRLFKNALVEFVKDILKPTWKEGHMSRDAHKIIVKKVVDKVSSTVQASHIPKTKDRVDQYLSSSKTKISKLVQAYVGRHVKAET